MERDLVMTRGKILACESPGPGSHDEQLRALVDEISDLYNNAPCGYHSLDGDGVFVRINDTELKWLGYDRAEIIGKKHLRDVLTPASQAIFDKNFPIFKQRGWVRDLEFELVGKDGGITPVLLSATARKDESGNFISSRSTLYDISDLRRAEQSKEQYIRFFRLATDPMVIADPFGCFRQVNPAFLDLTGYSEAELLAKPFSEFIVPEDREKTTKELQAQVSGRPTFKFENRYRCKDGRIVLLSWNAYYDTQDRVTYATARDITATRESEGKLRDAAVYARRSIEASVDAMVVIGIDGKIADLNRADEELTGLTRNALIGTDFSQYATEPEKARAGFKQVLERGIVTDYPLSVRHSSGKTTEVLFNASTLRDSHGAVAGVLAIARDMTEHLANERKARESAAYARNLIEASLDPFVVISREGRIMDVNHATEAATARSRKDLIGTDFADYFIEPDKAREGYRRVLAEGSVRDFPLTFRDAAGNCREALYNASTFRDESGAVAGVFAAARDITMRVRADRALRTLSAGNQALIHALDEGEFLNTICKTLIKTGGYQMAWIGFAEQDAAKSIRRVTFAGNDGDYLSQARISWADDEFGRGPTGTAVRTGTAQVNRDFAHNPNVAPWRDLALSKGYRSSIALPLISDGTCLGALTIYAGEPDAFDADEVSLMKELADDTAYGILALRLRAEAKTSGERLERSMEATIEAMATTIEMRDPYTAGHQRRTAALALAIGQKLELADEVLKGLNLAAKIHDIGKIKISAEILSYPGKLGALEMAMIKTHCQSGKDILKNVAFSWPIVDAVFQHHERLDGTGYPVGLKGDQICLEARIIGVADVVEAIMSHRPYRAALGLEAALAEITRGKGTHYEASVVEACLAVFRDGFALPPAM